MWNNESREGSPLECRKWWESNLILRTVEGSPMECSKSQENNHVVCTVSYAKIMIRNILLS